MNKQFNGKTKRIATPPTKLRSRALEEPLTILTNTADISLIDNGLSWQLHTGSINGTDERFVFQSFLYRTKSKCIPFYFTVAVSIPNNKKN